MRLTRWFTQVYAGTFVPGVKKIRIIGICPLSRFKGTPELLDPSTNPESEDNDWNTYVTLKPKPDDRLSTLQKKVVAEDYGMTRRRLLALQMRATLIAILCNYFRLITKCWTLFRKASNW